MHEYDAIIRSQLQQGIVEEVNPHNKGRSGHVHYLPHHAVVRKDRETTKLRIVYDASAKATGCSLNECLLKGPKFDLFLDDDGIWRCGGRLSNADIPYQTRHPILLPRDHYLTTLIVRRAHQRVLHNGVKDTLSEVRFRYWIVKGRAFVKKMIHHCIVCRKLEGKPFLGPSPPPLPSFRLTEDPPFTYTGVDFTGPLHIKKLHSAGGHKVWICLYTCCAVRAVHLNIVPNMTTTTFIHSLKHFSSRRGLLPKHFVSDNGQTIKATPKVVCTIVHHHDVQHYLSGIGVEWLFNLERAPWWGGVLERMV